MNEIEEQRPGRNKNTTINHTYISSGSYRNKFDMISNSSELNRILYTLSKQMLNHRSGTLYEDMYWIDLETNKIVAKETSGDSEEQIIYSKSTIKTIEEYKNDENKQLLTIHSHPNSFPPSAADFISNFENEYNIGVVVCHDGSIYLYSADEKIDNDYYSMVVERYLKSGYNNNEAQIMALNKIMENSNIHFKEVTDNVS